MKSREKGIFDTYQENDGDVQQEGDHSIGDQNPDTHTIDMVHGEFRDLQEKSNGAIHDSANRRKVVQGDHGVHLELSGAEQALHHDQTGGLEDNTTQLEQETDHDELNLTKRSNDDTNDDDRNVHEGLVVDGSHAHAPGSKKDSNGSSGLQLLLAKFP